MSLEALLHAPNEPGTYMVETSLDRTQFADASRQAEVYATTIGDSPLRRFESIDWDRASPPRP